LPWSWEHGFLWYSRSLRGCRCERVPGFSHEAECWASRISGCLTLPTGACSLARRVAVEGVSSTVSRLLLGLRDLPLSTEQGVAVEVCHSSVTGEPSPTRRELATGVSSKAILLLLWLSRLAMVFGAKGSPSRCELAVVMFFHEVLLLLGLLRLAVVLGATGGY